MRRARSGSTCIALSVISSSIWRGRVPVSRISFSSRRGKSTSWITRAEMLMPTHERLDALDLARPEVHLRLVVQPHAALLDGGAQLAEHAEATDRVLVELT